MENIKKICGDPLGAEVLPSAPSIEKLLGRIKFGKRVKLATWIFGPILAATLVADFFIHRISPMESISSSALIVLTLGGFLIAIGCMVYDSFVYGAVKLGSNQKILLVFDFATAHVDKDGKFQGTRSYMFNCDVFQHRDAVLTSLTATQFGMLIETLTGRIDPLRHQQYTTLHYPVLHEVTRAWLFVKTGNDGASIACEVEGGIFEMFIDPWVNKLMTMFHLRIVEDVGHIKLSMHYSFANAFRDWSRTPRVIELIEDLNLTKLLEERTRTNAAVDDVEAVALMMQEARKADRLADRVQFAELMAWLAEKMEKNYKFALHRLEYFQTPHIGFSEYVDYQKAQLEKSLQMVTTPLGIESNTDALCSYWCRRVDELREADRAQREGVRSKKPRGSGPGPED